MSDPVAGEEVVEEVWTPKAAAAAAEAVSLNQQQQQPKSFKFAALAGGISLSGVKSDDNMQPFAPAPPCPSSSLTRVMQVRRNPPEQ